jgi:hypothetical protein
MTLTVINTATTKLAMHDAARPWAIVRLDAAGAIVRCVDRYTTKAAAQRRLRALNRQPGQG